MVGNIPVHSLRPRKKCGSSALFFSSRRIKSRLLLSVSSPGWSPQAKDNLYKSRSTTKKSLNNFLESTPSNATSEENMRLDVNQEIIAPRVPQFTAELNVENLCGKQTTQL